MSTNYKFQVAQEKLITEAQRVAGAYLLTKYASAHIINEPKVELTHTIDPNSSSFVFNGKITVFATNLLEPVVGVNMTVNSNDIEIASEESIADKVENSLNAQQELEPIKASLDGFKLVERGDGYLLVSHSNLEESNLGIVGKNEYAKSPNKQELLETIVKDSMARIANETSISFTGSFVEPVIQKKAAGCDQCDAAMINGVFCHEQGCPNKKRKMHDEDMLDSEEGYVESKNSSWLTADLEEPMGDVWNLESPDQEIASQDLNSIVTQALDGDVSLQEFLSNLWDGESWESIKEKLETEGSTWQVWWMDGVNKFMSSEVESSKSAKHVSISENMPRASMSDTLAQSIQSEQQMHTAAQEKIKNEAVNSLVSMLQGMGFGSSKIAEVSMTDSKIDAMITLDDAGTTKVVNIPVEIKADKFVLPKRSLISELISKGLDIRAKLSESFSQEILNKIAAIEELENYKETEANSILTERLTVTKTASGYDNTQFLGDTDTLELQKHLIPNFQDLKKGDRVSDGNSQWEITDTEGHQNDKNEGSSSIWKLRKCAPPKSDEKEPETKIKI